MGIEEAQKAYRPYGAALRLMGCRDNEVLLDGPAGTGKSRGCLEKLHLCALKYPGMRGLIARKTRESLTESALVTFEGVVAIDGNPETSNIQRRMRQAYHYPNGSEIVCGGLDKPTRIMSTEYDLIYIQEAIELVENDWEALSTRLRNGKMPYQQLLGDSNPDVPHHWLNQRCERGLTTRIPSRHEDNPRLWDSAKGCWTAEGAVYIGRLDNLTGARYWRLRKGLWVSAEGIIFTEWDRAVHVIPCDDARFGLRGGVPDSWTRYWVVDFGFVNPFVWQEWASDGDGRLFRLREIYQTRTLVEDHARLIKELTRDSPRPRAVISDHDAEDRATLERHLGIGTVAAHKSVSDGLQAVQSRLRLQADGKARIYVLADGVHSRDPALEEAKLPIGLVEEIDGYVWDTSAGRKAGEQPLKLNDHGMDAMRYMAAYLDLPEVPKIPAARPVYAGVKRRY